MFENLHNKMLRKKDNRLEETYFQDMRFLPRIYKELIINRKNKKPN